MRRLGLLGLVVAAVGCFNFDGAVEQYCTDHMGFCDGGVSSDAGAVDAGAVDAGAVDAGAVDAGAVDAGAVDAGSVDAGSVDAGSVDAGPVDAGAVDAGAVDAGSADAGAADAGVLDAGSCPQRRPMPTVATNCQVYDFAAGIPGVLTEQNPSTNSDTAATATPQCGMLRVRYGAETGTHDLWCNTGDNVINTAYRLQQTASNNATSIQLWFQSALTADEQEVGVFSRQGASYAVGALAYSQNALSTFVTNFTANGATCAHVPDQGQVAQLGDAGVLGLERSGGNWLLHFEGLNTTTTTIGAASGTSQTLGVFVGGTHPAVDVFIEYVVICQ